MVPVGLGSTMVARLWLALASEPGAAAAPGDADDASPGDADDASPGDADDAAPGDAVDVGEPESAPPQPRPADLARVRGRVLTYGDRSAIAGATIVPLDGGTPVTADENGNFVLPLGAGSHAFEIRAVGFQTLSTKVTLSRNRELEFEYRLLPKIGDDRYRTIVRQRREIALSATTLREAEIREVAGTRGDPLRVVTSLPGVSQLSGLLPYVVVRGAAPGNTGYYLDGARVPILFHLALGPSILHPYFIDAVDFYPAGAPSRLGRFVSGIIEGRTRPSRRDRVHGDIDARLTDAGGLLEIPINRSWLPGCLDDPKTKRRLQCKRGPGKGALTLAGRYSYTGALISLVQSQARIKFWDYQARFDHRVAPTADFIAFAYGSYDDIGQKPPKGQAYQPYIRFHFHRLDLRVRQRLRREGSATYAVIFGLDESGFTAGDTTSQVYRTYEWRIAPRMDLRLPINDRVAIGLGIDQEFQIFRLANPIIDNDQINLEDISLLFSDRFVSASGAYLEALVRKGGFELRPGVRVDAYAQVGGSPYLPNATAVTHAVGVDPRMTLREKIARRWTLRQAVGMYHQPPAFPIPVPAIESFGFERGLQQNIQGAFGYEFDAIPDRLQLIQEAYGGYLSNLQDYDLGAASTGGSISELEDVITKVDGWAYGLETMLRLAPEMRMFGWAAYTLSRSVRNYNVGGRAPSSWDQRHILNVVLGYRISHKWNIGGRVHYHSGRPWTAPVGDQTSAEALAQNRNNARMAPFFQLDLRVERNWRYPDWQLDLFLDVNNATYSFDTIACGQSPTALPGGLRMGQLVVAAQTDPARGVAKCTPIGLRYTLPSMGLRARF
ncbi:MAG: TonB-dependent receptor [Nannocystaceae bacterium]